MIDVRLKFLECRFNNIFVHAYLHFVIIQLNSSIYFFVFHTIHNTHVRKLHDISEFKWREHGRMDEVLTILDQNIKLPIAKEIGQSHTMKSTDPAIWTVKGLLSQTLYDSKVLHLEKHYVIHATFLLDF